ncbi:hypothetical protein ACTFIY_003438 [Dictyostelium cf. discoideum]
MFSSQNNSYMMMGGGGIGNINNNQFYSPIISTSAQSFNSIVEWKRDIIRQLNDRNQNQTNNYSEFMRIYTDLLKRERTLNDRTLLYEKEIVSLRNEKKIQQPPSGSSKMDSSSLSSSSSMNRVMGGMGSTIEEMEQKLFKLQEDLTNSYKRNADNASSILLLNDKNKDLQNELMSKEIEIERIRSTIQQDLDSIKRLEMVVIEKENVSQIIRDELSSLQTEFLHNESKVVKLEQENSSLVERWLRKKNEEASKMNEANDFYQKMVEQRDNTPAKAVTQLSESISNLVVKLPDANDVPIPIVLERGVFSSEAMLPSKAKKRWTGHNSEIYCMAFNSIGNLLATGGGDKCVKVWDVISGQQKSTLLGASQSIVSVSFSPNDESILGTSNDNSARLWNTELGRSRHTLTGHIGKVYTGKFINSNRVVTGSHDRTIKLWDLQKGYCTRTIFCFSSCNDLVILGGSGTHLASGHVDHSVRFWDSNAGEPTQVLSSIHEGQITSITNSPTNTNQILTNSRDHTLKIIDIRTFDTIRTFKDPEYRNGLNWTKASWSPDGRFIASGSIDGSICIWDATNGKTVKVLTKVHNNGSSVCCCSWSPLANIFISADKDKNIIQWE